MTTRDRAPERRAEADREFLAGKAIFDHLPPGPSDDSIVRFRVKPTQLWEECNRLYGDPFTLRFAGTPPFVFFSSPEAIKQIFTGDEADLRAGGVTRWLDFLFGRGSLILLDGARHERERRLIVTPFHGERLHVHARRIRDIVGRAVDSWPLDRPFPIHAAMQAISLEVIIQVVFGVDEASRAGALRERLNHFLTVSDGAFGASLMLSSARRQAVAPSTPWGRYLSARNAVTEMLDAEIAGRRGEGTAGRTDVLSMLADARDDNGDGLDDEGLRDEMFTLLLGGNDTTSTTLAWALYRILPRPDVLQRLRDERERVIGTVPIEAPHVGQLPYLDAVIKETTRLDPPLLMVGRLLDRPMRIAGWELPAGVSVCPCIYLTHRRPDLWPEPERFDPDRFLGTHPSPYVFFPFGGGGRRCVGAAFAMYEMKIVLTEVLSRVELRLEPSYVARHVQHTLTVRPSSGMPVIVDRRIPWRSPC